MRSRKVGLRKSSLRARTYPQNPDRAVLIVRRLVSGCSLLFWPDGGSWLGGNEEDQGRCRLVAELPAQGLIVWVGRSSRPTIACSNSGGSHVPLIRFLITFISPEAPIDDRRPKRQARL